MQNGIENEVVVLQQSRNPSGRPEEYQWPKMEKWITEKIHVFDRADVFL